MNINFIKANSKEINNSGLSIKKWADGYICIAKSEADFFTFSYVNDVLKMDNSGYNSKRVYEKLEEICKKIELKEELEKKLTINNTKRKVEKI